MYLSNKNNHHLIDVLVTHDYSVLAICLVRQLLSELFICFFKPTNLVFKGCHVLTYGWVNPPKVLPC